MCGVRKREKKTLRVSSRTTACSQRRREKTQAKRKRGFRYPGREQCGKFLQNRVSLFFPLCRASRKEISAKKRKRRIFFCSYFQPVECSLKKQNNKKKDRKKWNKELLKSSAKKEGSKHLSISRKKKLGRRGRGLFNFLSAVLDGKKWRDENEASREERRLSPSKDPFCLKGVQKSKENAPVGYELFRVAALWFYHPAEKLNDGHDDLDDEAMHGLDNSSRHS
ncbi:hypothetical protein BSKO_02679 [Bryopsis sp. KO-2023]|nr:hypothetical protein BSKO_02679 [Bryopsis sp. KO-2023]